MSKGFKRKRDAKQLLDCFRAIKISCTLAKDVLNENIENHKSSKAKSELEAAIGLLEGVAIMIKNAEDLAWK